MASRETIAWAAGLFEGEGSVVLRIQNERAVIALSLGSTDLDVLERFKSVVGAGQIGRESRSSSLGNKPFWRWRCAAQADVARLTDMLLPFMGERRRNAFERAWHRFANQPAARVTPRWHRSESDVVALAACPSREEALGVVIAERETVGSSPPAEAVVS